jgi:hypothetical protein
VPTPARLADSSQQRFRISVINPGYKRDWRNVKGDLSLADAEYLGSAVGANALGRRPFVLQDDRSGVLDLDFPSALHAICLSHHRTSNITLAQQSNKPERICQ